MDISRVEPDLRPALRRVTRLTLPSAVLRPLTRIMPVPPLADVDVRMHKANGVPVRVYTPAGHRDAGALLWVHGGGLLFGDARQDEALCGQVAGTLGVTVVSVNYRLGPKNPYPAALEDVTTAWYTMQRRAHRLGLDPERIAIGGESAGGGIAAALAQRLVDDGGVQPAAQWLFAPMIDDRTAARTDLDRIDHLVWNNRANRGGWGAYLPHRPGAPAQPRYAVAARRTDLRGLPPAFIAVGDIDLFHEEDTRYAEALRGAGVPVTFDVVPGAPHGFENWARQSPPARALLARAIPWLGRHILDAGPAADGTA